MGPVTSSLGFVSGIKCWSVESARSALENGGWLCLDWKLLRGHPAGKMRVGAGDTGFLGTFSNVLRESPKRRSAFAHLKCALTQLFWSKLLALGEG